MNYTQEERFDFAQKIVDAVAEWQKSLEEQIKDDTKGRALIEACVQQSQTRLTEIGVLPSDLPALKVHWGKDGAGRTEPHFAFPADPPSAEMIALREKLAAEGEAMRIAADELAKTHCRECGQRLR